MKEKTLCSIQTREETEEQVDGIHEHVTLKTRMD